MKTTLCIVDMQPTFPGTAKALKGTLHQIKLAKRRKSDIIVLEIFDRGDTVKEIHDSLVSYDINKVRFASKTGSDGSREFIQAAKDKGFWLDRIRVCGVNTCACVIRTLEGFKRELPKSRLEVAWEAINCGCYNQHDADYKNRFKNIGVVIK